VESLLSSALSNAVVASLLAVIVAAVARICRRPAVVHALWLLVLLKLLTPPLVPLPVTWLRTPDATPVVAEALPLPGEPAEPPASLAETAEESVTPEADSAPADSAIVVSWSSVVLICWLCGSLAWWTIAGARLIRFHRLLQAARTAPETVQEQARRLAALLGLRRCPPVLFVSAPLTPMLWALGLSPRLLVPVELWRRLCVQQQDTLLAHELAHLRRGDHWVRRLEFVVLGLYWWHPVVWWARRRLQEAEEECCDARVIALLPDAASAYASVLVETVAFLSQTRAAALLGASGAGQVPLLKRRLTMILTANSSEKSSRVAFWSVLGLGALLLPLTPGSAQPEAPPPPEQPLAAEAKPEPYDHPITFTPHKIQAQQFCANCHHEDTVHARDLRQKPRSWQEAHEELVRKMDDLTKKQALLLEARKREEARKQELMAIVNAERDVLRAHEAQLEANKARRATEEHGRAEQIEKLQDEIELLKVQVKLKQTHLEMAKAELAAAEKLVKVMEEPYRAGQIPAHQLLKVETAVGTQKAQVRVKAAELQEPLVLLKQAERRLARLKQPPERAAVGGREQQEQRLRELEQKVKELLDEMKALQRELRPKQPDLKQPGNVHSYGRTFFNPFHAKK
jgi:bla regulator protein BlaR1